MRLTQRLGTTNELRSDKKRPPARERPRTASAKNSSAAARSVGYAQGMGKHDALFRAVVLSGAALTGCTRGHSPDSEDAASVTMRDSGGASDAGDASDGNVAASDTLVETADAGLLGVDAANTNGGSGDTGLEEKCPADAEIPFPPCFLIL